MSELLRERVGGLLDHPGLHRCRRLADQLDRPDHALQPGAAARRRGSPASPTWPACCRTRLQEIPGLLDGGIGWQGIVPGRAAKMGSIAVDKVIAKIGTPKEFYEQLDPPAIAEHIVTIMEPKVPEIVDEVMVRQHPHAVGEPPAPDQGRRLRAGDASSCPRSSTGSPTRSASTSTSCSTRRSW